MPRNISSGNPRFGPAGPSISGGYAKVRTDHVLRVWHGSTRLADLRVFLALINSQERARLNASDGGKAFRPWRDPGPRIESEIAKSTGLKAKTVRASLRRLKTAQEHAEIPAKALAAMPKRGATVPVPRRLLQSLARDGNRGTIGVALGACIRMLRVRRDGSVSGEGRCKATWLQEAFGLGQTTVKAGRRKLREIGWLLDDGQAKGWLWLAEHKHGRQAGVNRDWTPAPSGPRLVGDDGATSDPFMEPAKGGGSAPHPAPYPYRLHIRPLAAPHPTPSPSEEDEPLAGNTINRNRPVGRKNPAAPGTGCAGHGVFKSGGSPKQKETATGAPGDMAWRFRDACRQPEPASPLRKRPPLPHTEPSDLCRPGRLAALFRASKARGAVGDSESEKQDFYASAARATRVADNPPAMLASLVRNPEMRAHLGDLDDDAGSLLLKESEHGIEPHVGATPAIENRVAALSNDARKLQTAERGADHPGVRTTASELLSREGWNGNRVDTAAGELRELRRENYRATQRSEGVPDVPEPIADRIGAVHLPGLRDEIGIVPNPIVHRTAKRSGRCVGSSA